MIDALIGQTVSEVNTVHDYSQIWFSGGDVLNIYNHYSFSGEGGIECLIGRVMISCNESQNDIVLQFDEFSLEITLSGSKYSSPEAMELWLNDSEVPVVWAQK